MRDLWSQFKEGNYEFKDPWSPTEKSLTIVVPIIARRIRARKYVLFEEVKDKVRILDTGRIDKTRMEGNVDKPTFIRGGTMLKGLTQERTTQFGLLVVPSKSAKIPVHCIHASKGIRPGAKLAFGGYAPQRVYSTILSEKNQRSTWAEIWNYSAQHARSVGELRYLDDDLLKTVETLHRFDRDLRGILSKIPDYMDQVGAVVIDPEGVVGLEMYDHPSSWKAFSESIVRSYAEILKREDKTGIFKPDMNAAIPVIREFLKSMEKAATEEVYSEHNAKTVIVKTENYVGEYTTLRRETIHLLVTRRNPNYGAKRLRAIRRSAPSQRSTVQRVVNWGRQFKRKAKKAVQVVNTLQNKPKTWTAIKSDVSMSKATLSSRLRELQRLRVIEKSRDENGATRYRLTGIGHEYLRSQREPASFRHPAPVAGSAKTLTYVDVYPSGNNKSQPKDVCPECGSLDISVWGFNDEEVNFECNICRHKWTTARRKVFQ